MSHSELRVVWTDYERDYEHVVRNSNEAIELARFVHNDCPVPTMVDFFEPDNGPGLSIGVGRAMTVVNFQRSDDPPYFMSLGRVGQQGIITFCYGNEETEYPEANAVPISDGLEALRYFTDNRSRPPNIEWEKL